MTASLLDLSPADLPPEGLLLLACARARPGAADCARVRQLAAAPLDWGLLLRLAQRNGVVGLVFQALQVAGAPHTPADVMARLRAEATAHAQHGLRQVGELVRLAAALEAAGIPLIVLKGPVLAALAYESLALRSSVDLDILVHRRDLPRAVDLLRQRGYELVEQVGPPQVEAYLNAQHHFSLARGELLVELHHELRERYFSYHSGVAELWARATPVTVGGRALPALGYADQLITLCFHGLRHCWERLAWICDIAELLRQERDVDWPALLAGLRARGAERMLLLGLFLAHTLLDAPVPPALLARAAADPALPGLARDVLRGLVAPEPPERGLLASARFHLRARERLRDRLRYTVLLTFSPTMGDWSLAALPRPLAFLYYLIRPLRLAWSYGAGRIKAARRGSRPGQGT